MLHAYQPAGCIHVVTMHRQSMKPSCGKCHLSDQQSCYGLLPGSLAGAVQAGKQSALSVACTASVMAVEVWVNAGKAVGELLAEC